MRQPPDRDDQGRPRNARPRDSLGRLLPRDAVGVPTWATEERLSPRESIAAAQTLLDATLPFHAHEVLEAAWKTAPKSERELWRGLAQLAVGLTHCLRGNNKGARAVLIRGRDRIREYLADAPYGLDVAGLLVWAENLIGQLGEEGLTPEPPQLRVR